jgi:GST-like protein
VNTGTVHTLYGAPGSGSAAVEAALLLCGLHCQTVRAAPWEPGSAMPALLRVNPLGQIPTLVLPDGGVLTESAAILMHLGLQHPHSGLLPTEPGARAQALRGLVYIAANCYSAIGIGDHPERWTTATAPAERAHVRQGARRQLHRHWEIFADSFAAHPWLGGAELGALDLLASVVSRWSGARPHLAQARPAFAALMQAVDRHPRLASVFSQHWPG